VVTLTLTLTIGLTLFLLGEGPNQHLDICLLNQKDTKEAFQTYIALALGDHDPLEITSDEIASTIRSIALKSVRTLFQLSTRPSLQKVFP